MTDKNNLYVDLVAHEGPTSVYISAAINEVGDLVFSGQDLGAAPSAIFGDSDYEYWLTVPASHKHELLGILSAAAEAAIPASHGTDQTDHLLLQVIKKRYQGDLCLVSRVQTQLDEQGIPYSFATY